MKLFRSNYKKIISILVASSMLLGNYHPYVYADEPAAGEEVPDAGVDGDGAVVLGDGDSVPVAEDDVPDAGGGGEDAVVLGDGDDEPVAGGDEPATDEVPDAGVEGDGAAVLGDGEGVPVAEDDAPENLTAEDIRDAKITVSGYKEVDGKRYVKDHLTFHAPEGYYTSYNIGGAEEFAESYYDDGDIIIMYFDDGSAVNSDLEFWLKSKENGLESGSLYINNYLEGEPADYTTFVLDDTPPDDESYIDGEEFSIEDGKEVVCESLETTIYDENLYTATVNGEDKEITGESIALSFEAEEGNPKDISILVTDKAGNEFKADFTLVHPKDKLPEMTITIDDPGDIYVGTTYDLESKVEFTYGDLESPEAYTGTYSYKYFKGDTELSEKPGTSEPGSYKFGAYVNGDDNYKKSSKIIDFEISYLPIPENPVTITGLTDGKYAKESVSLQAKTGYQIKSNKTGAVFADTLAVSKEDIKNNGYMISMKKDGALTADTPLLEAAPGLADVVFDSDSPQISEAYADGTEISIEDGDDIAAESVKVVFYDANPFTIESSLGNFSVGDGVTGDDESGYQAELTFNAVRDVPKTCEITAKDSSGNEFSRTFTLTHPTDLYEDLTVTLADPGTVYVGTDYDFTSLVTLPDDYEGDWDFEYKKAGTVVTKPDSTAANIGDYTVQVIAEEKNPYKSGTSEVKNFSIAYLSLPEGVTMTGVKDGKYAKDVVVLTPPTDYKIKSNKSGSEYSGSLIVTEEDAESTSYKISFEYKNGARTNEVSLASVVPEISGVIFDADAPVLYDTPHVDGEEKIIADGDDVVGENVEITLIDDYLDVVEIVEDSTIKNGTVTGNGADGFTSTLVFNAVEGTPKNIEITAVDKSGNEFTFGFTLTHPENPLSELTIELADPEDVYVGTTYDFTSLVTVPDDYTGTWDIVYFYDGEEVSKPATDAPGTYTFKVVAEEDAKYKEAVSEEKEFSIKYLPVPTTPVTVSGIANEKYAKKDIVLTPIENYQIKSGKSDASFGGTLTVAEEDVNSEGYKVYFRRTTDGALTEGVTLSTVVPSIGDVIFDADAPVINKVLCDGEPGSIAPTIYAKVVKITFSDDNFDRLEANNGIVNGTSYIFNFNDNPLFGGAYVDCSLTAYDKSGNSITLNFKIWRRADAPDPEPTSTPKPGPIPEPTPTPTPIGIPVVEQDSKLTPELNMGYTKFFYGVPYNIDVNTNSDGKVSITYLSQGIVLFDKPSAVGTYVVTVTVAETEIYNKITRSGLLYIKYYPTPNNPYSLVGTMGENGYYTSDVSIKALDGYLISTSFDGPFSESIPYTENVKSVCLKHKTTGGITNYISIRNDVKIDGASPAFGEMSMDQDGNGVDLSGTVYADAISFNLLDEHLSQVFVDGKEVAINNGESLITLAADGGKKNYNITAYDEAGNEFSTTVTLYAAWLKDKVIPAGKQITLEAGEAYTLPAGKWKISGDNTIYTGGTEIYVSGTGQYTFTKID